MTSYEILHEDGDGDRLVFYTGSREPALGVISDAGEVYVPAGVVAAIRAALSGGVVVPMTREDAQELRLILDMDRQRMDKGDGNVPQPRWGANVRVSQAVQAALELEG